MKNNRCIFWVIRRGWFQFLRVLTAGIVFFLMSCAPAIKQYYQDYYHTEDSIYENRSLHFLLVYKGNWQLFTNPQEMDKSSRDFAIQLNKRGAELLFVGASVEGAYGSRGIAINLNEPALDYAQQVRELNKEDVQDDSGIVEFYSGSCPMAKWTYSMFNFRFAEFFINAGTYDVRIAFWTKKDSFENFQPLFEEIISSISFTHGI